MHAFFLYLELYPATLHPVILHTYLRAQTLLAWRHGAESRIHLATWDYSPGIEPQSDVEDVAPLVSLVYQRQHLH